MTVEPDPGHAATSGATPLPVFMPAGRVVAEVPWAPPPAARRELAPLEAEVTEARLRLDGGDGNGARKLAEQAAERVWALRLEDPSARAELDRLRADVLALLARTLAAVAGWPAASAAMHAAVRAAAAGRAADEGVDAPAHYHVTVDLLEDALDRAPRNPMLLAALADVHADAGAGRAAAGRFRELAAALAAQDAYDSAASTLARALELDPGSVETHLARADVFRLARQPSEARDALAEVDRLAPDEPRAVALEGLLLLADGDVDGAHDLLESVVVASPDEAWTHTNLALALHAGNRREEALRELDRALGLEGEHPTRILQKAVLLAEDGLPEEALELLDRALELDPGLTAAMIARADALRLGGRFAEALVAIDQALSREPRSGRALGVRGEVLRARGDLQGASKALAAAADVAPHVVEVQLALGNVLFALEDLEAAAAAYERALALDGESVGALTGKANVERKRGEFPAAHQTLDRAFELAPQSPRAATDRAAVLYQEENYDAAEAALRTIVDDHPAFGYAQMWLGEVLRVKGDYRGALEALDGALELEPRNGFARGTRGQVLLRLNRVEEGVEELRRAREAAPHLVWVVTELANGLRMLGHYDDAIATYETVLEDVEDRDEVMVKIGEIHLAAERYDATFAIARSIHEQRPDYVPALVLEAQAVVWVGRYAEAVETLDRAIELDGDNDWAIFLRALSHRNLGEDHFEAARTDYQRAISLDPEYPEYHVKLGDLIAVTEGPAAARVHFQWVLDNMDLDTPTPDPFALLVLGWAQAGVGLYDQAARSFRMALDSDPRDVPTRLDLALALLSTARLGPAKREYEEALRLAGEEDSARRRCVLEVALRAIDERVARLEADEAENHEFMSDVREAAAEAREMLGRSLDTP